MIIKGNEGKNMENKFVEDGLILLNKIKGNSSFKEISNLKKVLNCNKVGHCGTLDPMAEGLLIVMINNATKFSEELMKRDKEYYVEMELGYETDTYDSEGIKTREYKEKNYPSKEEIFQLIEKFQGKISQIPPMYSAIKIGGEKLYNLARKGIEIERQERKVEIYYIKNIKYDVQRKMVSFYTGVSSGTYIRSLVKDIGEKLGVYATMTKLVRTKIDKFSLENSIKVEEVDKDNGIKILSVENLLDYDSLIVNDDEYKNLKNGMTVLINYRDENVNSGKKFKVYLKNGNFVGVVLVMKKNKNILYIKREKYFL